MLIESFLVLEALREQFGEFHLGGDPDHAQRYDRVVEVSNSVLSSWRRLGWFTRRMIENQVDALTSDPSVKIMQMMGPPPEDK